MILAHDTASHSWHCEGTTKCTPFPKILHCTCMQLARLCQECSHLCCCTPLPHHS